VKLDKHSPSRADFCNPLPSNNPDSARAMNQWAPCVDERS
jgi:hypothetical protein